MDFTVENGYKCGLCPRRLASKYSLERHIRLKHKSDLEGSTSSAKKQKLEIAEFRQENNNNRGRLKHPKLDVKQASDPESDNNSKLTRNNKNNAYANNAGWVETNNIEELGNNNSESEESNVEYANRKEIDSKVSDNKEIYNKESDSNNSESTESNCTKELGFKHNLFEVIETCKDMCDKFGNCSNLATFRIHPSPVGMGCTNKYIEWMRELFTGILDYFSQKYKPEAEY